LNPSRVSSLKQPHVVHPLPGDSRKFVLVLVCVTVVLTAV